MNQKLTIKVQNAIGSCAIDGNCLRLPSTQWPRELYLDVKSALEKEGGKYKRGGIFQFTGDAGAKIAMMLKRGVAVDERKKFQAFFTPDDVADFVAYIAGVNGKVVLEPSAGKGALARACLRAGAAGVSCIELNPECAAQIKVGPLAKFNGLSVICKDFMRCRPARTVDRVVMNPPFSNRQDVKHVWHALDWLAEDGILVAIMQANHIDLLTPRLGCLEWTLHPVSRDAFTVETSIIKIIR